MLARSVEDICNLALLYAGLNLRIGLITERSAAAQACNTLYVEARRKVLGAFRWQFAVKRVQLVPYSGDAYVSTTTYALGTYAVFGNNVYRSLLTANLGHQPNLDASAAWWAQVTRDGYGFACPFPDDVLDPIDVWEKLNVSSTSVQPVFTFTRDTSGNIRNPRSSGREPFKLENANDTTDNQVLLTDLDTPILRYVADVSNPAAFPSTFVQCVAKEMSPTLAMSLKGDEAKAKLCKIDAKMELADAFVNDSKDMQEDQEPVSEFEASRGGTP